MTAADADPWAGLSGNQQRKAEYRYTRAVHYAQEDAAACPARYRGTLTGGQFAALPVAEREHMIRARLARELIDARRRPAGSASDTPTPSASDTPTPAQPTPAPARGATASGYVVSCACQCGRLVPCNGPRPVVRYGRGCKPRPRRERRVAEAAPRTVWAYC